jgi:hypothetical protein
MSVSTMLVAVHDMFLSILADHRPLKMVAALDAEVFLCHFVPPGTSGYHPAPAALVRQELRIVVVGPG